MIPYDVQLIWAMILNEWKISEMKTWEWKTLVAWLCLYLNSLEWKGCHLVTVNDYLAERDAKEMWVLFDFLWVSVWVIKHWQSFEEKKKLMKKILFIEQIMNFDLIIFVIIWHLQKILYYKEN